MKPLSYNFFVATDLGFILEAQLHNCVALYYLSYSDELYRLCGGLTYSYITGIPHSAPQIH